MSPRDIQFNPDQILTAALDTIRQEGWENCSARQVARRLGASVAPLYRAFGSMEALQRSILGRIREELEERANRQYTEIQFLNIGVGVVQFAREEPRLFQALFLSHHGFQEVLEQFRRSILERMETDQLLKLLPAACRENLLANLCWYTVGLATAAITGQDTQLDLPEVIRRLKEMGSVLMYAEASGLMDCESDAARRHREALFDHRTTPPEAFRTGAGRRTAGAGPALEPLEES